MHNVIKAFHLLGLAMFLGSVLGHITIGFVPGAEDQPSAIAFGRHAISIATWALTIPGLALLAVSGLYMSTRKGLGFGRHGWLTAHQLLGLTILINAAFVLTPVGGELLREALMIARGDGSLDRFAALSARESLFGAANVALALLATFVAVLKPRSSKL